MKIFKINIIENVSHETNLFLPNDIKIFNKGITYSGYCSYTGENKQIIEKNSFIKFVILGGIIFFYFYSQEHIDIPLSDDSEQRLEKPIYLFERTGGDLYHLETYYKIIGIKGNDLRFISVDHLIKNNGDKEISIKHQSLPISYFEPDLDRGCIDIFREEFMEKAQEGIKLLDL